MNNKAALKKYNKLKLMDLGGEEYKTFVSLWRYIDDEKVLTQILSQEDYWDGEKEAEENNKIFWLIFKKIKTPKLRSRIVYNLLALYSDVDSNIRHILKTLKPDDLQRTIAHALKIRPDFLYELLWDWHNFEKSISKQIIDNIPYTPRTYKTIKELIMDTDIAEECRQYLLDRAFKLLPR